MAWYDQFQDAPTQPTMAGSPAAAAQQGQGSDLAMPQTGLDVQGAASSLQGEDFLREIERQDPGFARVVRSIGEGRAPYPQGFIMKTPYGRTLVNALGQAYPDLTAQDYHTRQKTADDFKSGASARAVKAANQAILHANTALEASEKLGGFDTLPAVMNPTRNAVMSQFSKDYQTHKAEYEGAITALSTELAKSFAGKAPALAEIEHWRQNSMVADSPTTRRANLTVGMKLLNGALESLVDQYNRGMLTNKEAMDLLAPHNRDVFTRIMVGEKPVATKTGGFTGKGDAEPPKPGNYVYDPATKTLKPAQ